MTTAAQIDIRRALAIPGYMHEDELRWLAQHATEARVVVEVGSYKGRSTRALADHCPGVVFAVDPWDGGYRNDDGSQAQWLDTKGAWTEFEMNLRDHIEAGRVIPVRAHFRPSLAIDGSTRPADLIFLDGDHRYEEVRHDILLGRTFMARGGHLAGHDYGHKAWPGVKRAVDEIFGNRVSLCRSIWWVRV